MSWRRISDWKTTVTLVRLAEVPADLVRAGQLVPPAEQVRPVAPRLAELATRTGFARVEPALAQKLGAAGVTLWEVGYHRGSDGMRLAIGPRVRDLDMAALVGLLAQDDADDEAFDRLRDDAVDAVLRTLSQGQLTERAVLVAALLPPLGAGPVQLEGELYEVERQGGAGLPEASAELVEQVAAALIQLEAMPRQPPGPQLSPEARRRYIRQSLAWGGGAALLSLIALRWTPWVAVLALPVVVVCATAVAIHTLALRQQRGAAAHAGRKPER